MSCVNRAQTSITVAVPPRDMLTAVEMYTPYSRSHCTIGWPLLSRTVPHSCHAEHVISSCPFSDEDHTLIKLFVAIAERGEIALFICRFATLCDTSCAPAHKQNLRAFHHPFVQYPSLMLNNHISSDIIPAAMRAVKRPVNRTASHPWSLSQFDATTPRQPGLWRSVRRLKSSLHKSCSQSILNLQVSKPRPKYQPIYAPSRRKRAIPRSDVPDLFAAFEKRSPILAVVAIARFGWQHQVMEECRTATSE